MKKYIMVSIPLIVAAFVYAITGFVACSFDISELPAFARFCMAIMWVWLSGLAMAFYVMIKP